MKCTEITASRIATFLAGHNYAHSQSTISSILAHIHSDTPRFIVRMGVRNFEFSQRRQPCSIPLTFMELHEGHTNVLASMNEHHPYTICSCGQCLLHVKKMKVWYVQELDTAYSFETLLKAYRSLRR